MSTHPDGPGMLLRRRNGGHVVKPVEHDVREPMPEVVKIDMPGVQGVPLIPVIPPKKK